MSNAPDSQTAHVIIEALAADRHWRVLDELAREVELEHGIARDEFDLTFKVLSHGGLITRYQTSTVDLCMLSQLGAGQAAALRDGQLALADA